MPKRIHLICGSHIDPIWLWNWEDGAAETLSTFRIAAEFCEKYDDFIFCHNEALLYEWIEEYDKSLFSRITSLIKAGKWHIMGGWYLQPDCNLLSGESFVRQILAGRKYFADKFGVTPNVALNFDSFGHTRGLVQILKKSGYSGYMFTRPQKWLKELPAEVFDWEGYDGSRITAARLPGGGYGTLKGEAVGKIEKIVGETSENQTNFVVWGIGNHGGALSKLDLDMISEKQKEWKDDVSLIHSTPERLFEKLDRSDLPVFKESLNPCFPGCYTSMSLLKQKYRRIENLLFSTEKLCSHAAIRGLSEYPHESIAAAERELLLTQFHDALAGTVIEEAEHTLLDALGHAGRLLSKARMKAFMALCAGQRRAYPDAIPIMVYNPFPYEIEADIACDFMLWAQDRTGDFLKPMIFDEDGKLIPSQCEKEKSTLAIEWAKRVIFRSKLKPMSMNRFDCRFERLPEAPLPELSEENHCFVTRYSGERIVIDTDTGLLREYSRHGEMIIQENAFSLEIYKDNYDPWGMLQSVWTEKLGEFRLLSPEEGRELAALDSPIPSVRVIENGDVRTVIEAVFGYKTSRAIVKYIISRSGGLELELRVIWNEHEKMLRLRVPLAFGNLSLIGEQAYGAEEMKGGMLESCSQRYIFADGGDTSLLICNDGSYGSAYDEKTQALYLTLLRSPIYSGHPTHETGNVPTDRYCPHIDIGEHIFHFTLNAGDHSLRETAARKAALLNCPPISLSCYPDGSGDIPAPAIRLTGDNAVELITLRPALDKNGYIARLFNPTDRARTAEIIFDKLSEKLTFAPFEIITLRIFENRIRKVTLTENECEI